MKHFFFLLFLCLLATSCSSEGNCLQKKGHAVERVDLFDSFDEIDIPKGVEVEIVPEGPSRIVVQSYSNRIDQIQAQIQDKRLIITNANSCAMLHDYKVAHIKIYTPTLKTIYSRTQFKVFSNQTLTYPELTIISSLPKESASSEIEFKIENQYVRLEDNKVGWFKISGKTNFLQLDLFGGNPRVEAERLEAQEVQVFHRSINQARIYPVKTLKGTLYSTGDLILYHVPESIDVEEKYSGKVVYF